MVYMHQVNVLSFNVNCFYIFIYCQDDALLCEESEGFEPQTDCQVLNISTENGYSIFWTIVLPPSSTWTSALEFLLIDFKSPLVLKILTEATLTITIRHRQN